MNGILNHMAAALVAILLSLTANPWCRVSLATASKRPIREPHQPLLRYAEVQSDLGRLSSKQLGLKEIDHAT